MTARRLAALSVLVASSCATTGQDSPFGRDGGASSGSGSFFAGDDGSGGFGGGFNVSDCSTLARSCDSCQDFPAAPLIDASPDDGSPPTPMDAASHFADPGLGAGGPCLVEPSDGTLIPQNWLRPRFRYAPVSGSETLFEIRIHAQRQKNDLVVYTTSKTWKMPKPLWDALRASAWDEDITVTVRGV